MHDNSYFHDITNLLRTSIHPEVCHFRAGNHPGINWYLKTVCPMPNLMQIDKFGYGLMWSTLAEEDSNSVKIVPHAYDWEGNDIPYMASVWLNIECDIIISMHPKTGYNLILVDRNIGSDFYVNNLLELLVLAREQTKGMEDIAKYLGELDEIEEIALILKKEIDAENASEIRKEFKVVDGGLEEDE